MDKEITLKYKQMQYRKFERSVLLEHFFLIYDTTTNNHSQYFSNKSLDQITIRDSVEPI